MTDPNKVVADICGRITRIERLYDLVERSLELNPKFDSIPESEFKKPKRPSSLDVIYVHYYAIHQVVLSREDVADIKRVICERLEKGIDKDNIYWVFYLLYIVEFRLKMLLHKKIHDRINIIPLGESCLPWAMTTKWGIKKPRALGERSFPFDLAITRLLSVLLFLETHFSEYLDDRWLYFDPVKRCCVHKKIRTLWNHETGEAWSKNNFSKLKKRYLKRVDNFYQVIRENKTSLFFIHSLDQTAEDIK